MHLGFLARAPEASARQSRQPSRVSLGCVTTTARRRAAGRFRCARFLLPTKPSNRARSIEATRLVERFPLDAAAITQSAQEFFMLDELSVGRRDAVGRGLLGSRAERVRASRHAAAARRVAAGRAG